MLSRGRLPWRCPRLACGAPLWRSKGVKPWRGHMCGDAAASPEKRGTPLLGWSRLLPRELGRIPAVQKPAAIVDREAQLPEAKEMRRQLRVSRGTLFGLWPAGRSSSAPSAGSLRHVCFPWALRGWVGARGDAIFGQTWRFRNRMEMTEIGRI
jgi:hypothetical protein